MRSPFTAYWALLLIAITVSVVGQALLKAGSRAASLAAQAHDVRTIAGLALYGLAALFYIVALRRIPLSVALPCTALSYVAATFIGHIVFMEQLTPRHLGALGLICVGVILLALP